MKADFHSREPMQTCSRAELRDRDRRHRGSEPSEESSAPITEPFFGSVLVYVVEIRGIEPLTS